MGDGIPGARVLREGEVAADAAELERLRALVVRWRAVAGRRFDLGSVALRNCANELEALLEALDGE